GPAGHPEPGITSREPSEWLALGFVAMRRRVMPAPESSSGRKAQASVVRTTGRGRAAPATSCASAAHRGGDPPAGPYFGRGSSAADARNRSEQTTDITRKGVVWDPALRGPAQAT